MRKDMEEAIVTKGEKDGKIIMMIGIGRKINKFRNNKVCVK